MYQRKSTKPSGPKTGQANSKCYAAHLNDCSDEIEKEHPFPRCALEELFDSTAFEATGWIIDKTIPLTANNAASNILCSRHNRALSLIDSVIGEWTQITKIMHGEIPPPINGYRNVGAPELAKNLLQISCGIIEINKRQGAQVEVPKRWVEVLFDEVQYDLRLFQTGSIGDQILNEKRFNHTILEVNCQPIGCVLKTKGFAVATFIDFSIPKQYFPANRIKHLLNGKSKFMIYFR